MKKIGHSADNGAPEMAFAHSTLGQKLLENMQEGSLAHRRIADFVLRNHVKVMALGIEDMAKACDVSTATISRFARELGFSNFAAMKNRIAEIVQAVLQPVEKLRNQIEGGTTHISPALHSMRFAQANLEAAQTGLTSTALTPIVHKLSKAHTVYVMGFGLSAHLAGLLSLHLQPFCAHVVEVAGYGGTEVAAGHLASVTEKDVLFVISFPRYALDVVRLTHFVRDRGASVIALTDSPASPIARLGEHLLLAPSTHEVLPSSMSAALGVIEALVSTLMVSNKKNVEKALRLTEAISAYLHSPDLTNRHSKTPGT